MAHEIEKFDTMFAVRTPPWHNLGVVLDNPPTSEEAILSAGLDWDVGLFPLNVDLNGEKIPVDGYATMRLDKTYGNIPLGVVGSRYTPLQNREAFIPFDALVKDGIATYETAGSLRNGKKVWILAKVGAPLEIGDNDKVEQYVLLSNSHDGSSTVIGKITPVRVVCANTLSAALHTKANFQNQFSIRHTKSVKDRTDSAMKMLETVQQAYDKLGKVWSKMAEIHMPEEEQLEYIMEVFPNKEDSKNEKRLQSKRVEVIQLLSSGAGASLDSAMGTLWGSYNAVTEYITHSVSTRKNSSIDTHLDNLWFGRHQDTLEAAFDAATRMMERKGVDLNTL